MIDQGFLTKILFLDAMIKQAGNRFVVPRISKEINYNTPRDSFFVVKYDKVNNGYVISINKKMWKKFPDYMIEFIIPAAYANAVTLASVGIDNAFFENKYDEVMKFLGKYPNRMFLPHFYNYGAFKKKHDIKCDCSINTVSLTGAKSLIGFQKCQNCKGHFNYVDKPLVSAYDYIMEILIFWRRYNKK